MLQTAIFWPHRHQQSSKIFEMNKVGALILYGLACASAFVVQPWAGKHGCNDPSYWCKNKETAQECGVLEYCKIEWGSTQTTDIISKTEPRNTTKPDASPVKVTLYYESLCPDCKQFIQYQWYPAYQKLQSSGILDVELVPYGNARLYNLSLEGIGRNLCNLPSTIFSPTEETFAKEYQYGSSWVFYCQHGASECQGNLIETCAIHVAGDASKYAPFIHCLEYYGPTTTNAQYCASAHGIDYAKINSCVTSSQGNELEHQMALKTAALNPPHQYVPWITVNGVHTNAIQTAVQTNMLAYVCEVYQGTKPAACSQATLKRSNVCYRD